MIGGHQRGGWGRREGDGGWGGTTDGGGGGGGVFIFLFWLDACFKTDGVMFSPSSFFAVLGEGGWGRGDLTVYGGCGGGDGGGDATACG